MVTNYGSIKCLLYIGVVDYYLISFLSITVFRFIEDNPMKSIENPLEEGLKKFRNGDLPSAVLFFEAEVQQNPNSIDGWQYLGTSQAHNEQDVAAIAASEK